MSAEREVVAQTAAE